MFKILGLIVFTAAQMSTVITLTRFPFGIAWQGLFGSPTFFDALKEDRSGITITALEPSGFCSWLLFDYFRLVFIPAVSFRQLLAVNLYGIHS